MEKENAMIIKMSDCPSPTPGPSCAEMLRRNLVLPPARDPYDGVYQVARTGECALSLEEQTSLYGTPFQVCLIEPEQIDRRTYLRWVLEELPWRHSGGHMITAWCLCQLYPGSTLWAWIDATVPDRRGTAEIQQCDTEAAIGSLCMPQPHAGSYLTLEPSELVRPEEAYETLRQRLNGHEVLRRYKELLLSMVENDPKPLSMRWLTLANKPGSEILRELHLRVGTELSLLFAMEAEQEAQSPDAELGWRL